MHHLNELGLAINHTSVNLIKPYTHTLVGGAPIKLQIEPTMLIKFGATDYM
jgi:hypothetical protein